MDRYQPLDWYHTIRSKEDGVMEIHQPLAEAETRGIRFKAAARRNGAGSGSNCPRGKVWGSRLHIGENGDVGDGRTDICLAS